MKYQGYVYRFMALFAKTKTSSIQVDQNDISYLANKLLACDYHNTYLTYNDSELLFLLKWKTSCNLFQKKFAGTFKKDPNFMTKLTKHVISLVQHRVALLPDTPIEILAGLSHPIW